MISRFRLSKTWKLAEKQNRVKRKRHSYWRGISSKKWTWKLLWWYSASFFCWWRQVLNFGEEDAAEVPLLACGVEKFVIVESAAGLSGVLVRISVVRAALSGGREWWHEPRPAEALAPIPCEKRRHVIEITVNTVVPLIDSAAAAEEDTVERVVIEVS